MAYSKYKEMKAMKAELARAEQAGNELRMPVIQYVGEYKVNSYGYQGPSSHGASRY